MARTNKLEVISGPTTPPPWDTSGRGPISRAEGDYNYTCGTCDYLMYRDRYAGEIKGDRTVMCPVCGSTLRA